MVILPLVFFNVLPESELLTFLIAPPATSATATTATTASHRPEAQTKVTVDPNKFVAPTEIPKEIPPPVDEPVVATEQHCWRYSGGVTGGVVGGSLEGLLVEFWVESAPAAPPPPPPRPVKRAPIRIGGDVIQSKLIKKVEPIYPELAKRDARISGTVVLSGDCG